MGLNAREPFFPVLSENADTRAGIDAETSSAKKTPTLFANVQREIFIRMGDQNGHARLIHNWHEVREAGKSALFPSLKWA
jgi:hypothetical protein